MRPLIVAHGLEGSPEGFKVQAYRAAGLIVDAPDGREKPLAVRIEQVRERVRERPGGVLVGSSYGGLASVALVDELGDSHDLHALVLLAPALHRQWTEPHIGDPDALMVPASLPCTIFHGLGDTVVPVTASRSLATRCPHVTLVETDDDHQLVATLPRIIEHLERLVR